MVVFCCWVCLFVYFEVCLNVILVCFCVCFIYIIVFCFVRGFWCWSEVVECRWEVLKFNWGVGDRIVVVFFDVGDELVLMVGNEYGCMCFGVVWFEDGWMKFFVLWSFLLLVVIDVVL